MKYRTYRLTQEHYDEAMKVLGDAFARGGPPKNFPQMFPRVFSRDARQLGDNFIAVEEGKDIAGNIDGFISSCEMTYHVGDEVLKISSSGNVGVKESARGRGLMNVLFDAVRQSLKEDGFAMSYLHGARTRYRYYGYELCGVEYRFDFLMTDLEKRYQNRHLYRFLDLREHPELIEEAVAINQAQKVHVDRRADEFLRYMTTYSRRPVAVIKDGKLLGSFSMGDDCALKYPTLREYDGFVEMLFEYMQENGLNAVVYEAPDYNKSLLRACMKDNSTYSLKNPANFLIVDLPKVVRAFLQLKADNEPLCDGEITIDSDLFGKYRIALHGGKASVEPFEGEAKYQLRGFEVYEFLFGMTPTPTESYDAAVASWLPLPINAPYLA